MSTRSLVFLFFGFICFGPGCGSAAEVSIPTVRDPRLELSLVAAEPEIVTPIGLAIDKRGRLFVVESHTHFPLTNYPGPKYDRIKLFQDFDKDGQATTVSIFADNLYHAMNLAFSPDGRLYVAHRNGVIRLEDKDGNGVSEARTVILQMDTPGQYPHNGIGGIAFSPDGWLYVGQGENQGEDYTLKGTDGRSIRGGGEGGNVFRCRPDGSGLERVATGFWNPFGLVFHGKEYLLAVDNDPDSRPPNRLLDVIPQGDYGYKFRFGRTGLHPYQAWNGELPGTLPMAGGTGEGACAVLPCDQTSWPASYHDAVLVTSSWDHQVEVHRLKRFGASWRATREVLVQGDDFFRPVALAVAPDGAVYFTDWVDKSYHVHGFGRLWRLAARSAVGHETKPAPGLAANASRVRMRRLLDAGKSTPAHELVTALSDRDPFLRSAAIASLSRQPFQSAREQALTNQSASVRLGALLASHRATNGSAAEIVGRYLLDPDPDVRLVAMIWAGEEKLKAVADKLTVSLSAGPVSSALLRAHAATVALLAESSNAPAIVPLSSGTPFRMRLAEKPDERAFIAVLEASAGQVAPQMRMEAVRSLAQTTNSEGIARLRRLALNRREETEARCEAILSLVGAAGEDRVLISLLDDPALAVRVEAARALRARISQPPVLVALERKLATATKRDRPLAEQLNFALAIAQTNSVDGAAAAPGDSARPSSDADWRRALEAKGDPASGRRLFFHPAVGCANCHRIEDHGGRLGPDLSTIARGSDREKLLQSLLHPSKELAPQFVTHTIETKDGEVYSGLLLGDNAQAGVTILTSADEAVLVRPEQMARHDVSTVSLMPEGMEHALTVQDFRDLLAFLLSRR